MRNVIKGIGKSLKRQQDMGSHSFTKNFTLRLPIKKLAEKITADRLEKR